MELVTSGNVKAVRYVTIRGVYLHLSDYGDTHLFVYRDPHPYGDGDFIPLVNTTYTPLENVTTSFECS